MRPPGGHDAHGRRPYAFDSVERALRVAEQIAEYDIFFLETPLWADDIDGYSRLAAASPVPIAAGEWPSSLHVFRELIDHSAADVLQPDIGRVGGFTEARRVCDMAADAGHIMVPHAWKTGISVAAAAHLAPSPAHAVLRGSSGRAVRVPPAGPDGRRPAFAEGGSALPPARPRRRAQPALRGRRGGGACRLTCVPPTSRMPSAR
jgi:L-alanine-DL-glutamate epimerase-like enolase superfamily enzyme